MTKPLRKSNTKTRPGSHTGRRKGIPISIHGFTLSQLARGVNMSKSHVCHIFSGKRSVSLRLALRISQFLGVTCERLAFELEQCARIARQTGHPIDEIANITK